MLAECHLPIRDDGSQVFATCNKCFNAVVVVFRLKRYAGVSLLMDVPGDPKDYGFEISDVYPKIETFDAPKHTPEKVRNPYRQGTDNIGLGNWDAAGMMFRKALDLATLVLDPTGKGKNLRARIDALEAARKVTPDLKDWAHRIRLDGNEAAHEDEPISQVDAKRLHEFTELFLTFVFTLRIELEQHRPAEQPKLG